MSEFEGSQENEDSINNWSENEVSTLIDVWELHIEDLCRAGRKRTVYDKIAALLNHAERCSPPKSGRDVAYKIKKLKTQYSRNKKKFDALGVRSCPWRFYNRIDKFVNTLLVRNATRKPRSLIPKEAKVAKRHRQKKVTEECSTESVDMPNLCDMIPQTDQPMICQVTIETADDAKNFKVKGFR